MEELQPSINIISISLQKVEFNTENWTPKKDSTININFRIERKLSEDKKSLEVILGILINSKKESENSGFVRLLVEMIGKFSAGTEKDISLEEFSKVNAASIIMPYIREAVTDFTAKAGIQPLILPPISIYRLIEQEKNEQLDISGSPSQ